MGRRLTWLPFIVVTLLGAVITLLFYKTNFKVHLDAFKKLAKLTFSNQEEFAHGYLMTALSMNALFQFIIPIFIAVSSGLMVAGEAEQGTLRACLIRPVPRPRLILAKFTILWFYAMVVCCFSVLLMTGLGVANFGTGTLYAVNPFFNNGQEGVSIITADEMPRRLVLASLMAACGMSALSALALLVSSLVETAAMAYVITLSIYFIEFILRVFPFLDWLHPYLFATHMLRYQQVFYSEIKWGDIYVSLIHLTGYIIAFLSAAVFLFKEKDIKS